MLSDIPTGHQILLSKALIKSTHSYYLFQKSARWSF